MNPRSIVRWLWIPVLLAFVWSGYVLWSRRAATEAMERAAEQKRAEQDKAVLDKLGGNSLTILMFYPNPPVIAKGQQGLLCYGVSNAASVRIEPGVEEIGPSLSRCVAVRPTKSTEYTLKAKDGQGREVAQTVSVEVR